jgi:hypothetical protein
VATSRPPCIYECLVDPLIAKKETIKRCIPASSQISAQHCNRPLADADGEVINPRRQSILTSALLLGLEAAPTKPQPQQDVAAALRRSHMQWMRLPRDGFQRHRVIGEVSLSHDIYPGAEYPPRCSRISRAGSSPASVSSSLAQHSSMARTLNSSISRLNSQLTPLKSQNNQVPPGFRPF